MKTMISKTKETSKRTYSKPEIEIVKIDNEISLVMMSANPTTDPTEGALDLKKNDPFKNNNLA